MVHCRCFALPKPARLMRCFLSTAYGRVLVRFSPGQVGCPLRVRGLDPCGGAGGAKEGLPSWSGAIKSQYSNEPAMAPNQCVKNG